MTIGLDVGRRSLFNLRRFFGHVGRRQKAAGNARSEPVHHPENALHVLPFELVREQYLATACVLCAHVEAKLRRANLQQCAGNISICARIARGLLCQRGIH